MQKVVLIYHVWSDWVDAEHHHGKTSAMYRVCLCGDDPNDSKQLFAHAWEDQARQFMHGYVQANELPVIEPLFIYGKNKIDKFRRALNLSDEPVVKNIKEHFLSILETKPSEGQLNPEPLPPLLANNTAGYKKKKAFSIQFGFQWLAVSIGLLLVSVGLVCLHYIINEDMKALWVVTGIAGGMGLIILNGGLTRTKVRLLPDSEVLEIKDIGLLGTSKELIPFSEIHDIQVDWDFGRSAHGADSLVKIFKTNYEIEYLQHEFKKGEAEHFVQEVDAFFDRVSTTSG